MGHTFGFEVVHRFDQLLAEALEHALRNLVRALVMADLFSHQEDVGVAAHFLRHGVAQGFAQALESG